LFSGEQRHIRELDALHQATATLLTTLDLDELLAHVLKGAIGSIPTAQTGLIYLANHRDNQLELKTIQGFHDPRVEEVLRIEKGYSLTTWIQQKPLLIPDIRADRHIHYDDTIPEIRALRSAISVPLLAEEGVLGVLSLDSFNNNAFTEDDLQLLVTFAKTASTAIINAQTHQETERLAITDSLTELYNRRHLFELGRREFVRAKRYTGSFLLMIDLDHFKLINDTCGHATGDQVLHVIADRCREAIREVDILGRYGGEEFCAVLPEATTVEAAEVADRIRRRVADKVVLTEQGTFSITISVGVAGLNANTIDFLDLMHQADIALYEAKQTGRNRVSIIR
jgi:diguanylate cyclase (GGDEF)-like protein